MYLEFLKCVAGEASGDAIYKMMAAKTGDGDKNRAKNTYLCFSYDLREIRKNIIPSGY